ncbi:nuclear transport factor 2 family protein [Microbispora hainanensis]|uniref:nuclear transport factor 2 family protein n=1 Tax=Microbispora hainanensis TaxID=568844 RepID=UPI002E298E56|nr:nuclear transport factor 2 family protein [Microbispora hainanensis]
MENQTVTTDGGGFRAVADPDLSARVAQLLYAYARAVDEGDVDALGELIADDVAITRVDGTHTGREPFLDVYRAFRDSPTLGSKHMITNVRAYPEDGGLVRAEAYFQAVMFDPDGTRFVIGRYSDSLREVGGELRFAHKRIMVERVAAVGGTREWTGAAPA